MDIVFMIVIAMPFLLVIEGTIAYMFFIDVRRIEHFWFFIGLPWGVIMSAGIVTAAEIMEPGLSVVTDWRVWAFCVFWTGLCVYVSNITYLTYHGAGAGLNAYSHFMDKYGD